MLYKDIDKQKKYANDRIYFILHKGKVILFHDYTNLKEQAFLDVICETTKFENSVETESKEILNLVDFSNSTANKDIIKELVASTDRFSVPKVKKTAVIGLTPLQKIFLSAFHKIGLSDVAIYNTKEEALDWLVED